MADIAVVGAGYVGLVTGACWAHLGHNVTFLDIDRDKVARLRRGIIPIYEPGLAEMIEQSTRDGRAFFTTDAEEAIPGREFIFVAVHTPSASNGNTDLMAFLNAIHSMAMLPSKGAIIVQKSTAPIGTAEFVEDLMSKRNPDAGVRVVANPEFLREGTAIEDFLNPERIVLGSADRAAADRVAELYSFAAGRPVIITDCSTAEMIKYASNAFLATKISFMNEIAQLCDAANLDVRKVAEGMGHDRRIGHKFLGAGLGWGGSCLPKDVKALVHMANGCDVTPSILEAVQRVNATQRSHTIRKLDGLLGGLEGAVVGLLGLAFKPGTDDLRSAPSIDIAQALVAMGALPRAYDPVAMDAARSLLPGVAFCNDPYELAEGADALVLITEWPQFNEIDMRVIRERMRRPVLVDGRNFWNGEKMSALGFKYQGFGVPSEHNGNHRAITSIAEALGMYP